MAASKQPTNQTFKHTHARTQCSNTSVGFAQAHPNNLLSNESNKHWGEEVFMHGKDFLRKLRNLTAEETWFLNPNLNFLLFY